MVFFGVDEGNGSWEDLYALHTIDGSLAWKQRITDVSGIGGLLVSHDLIYIETGASTDSSDYLIQALNISDGSLRWSYRYRADFSDVSQGLNAVGNGKLYFTNSHTLYALNATTGLKLWQISIPSDQKFSGVILSGSTIYATSSSSCFNCEILPASSAVHAFNAKTGTSVWQSQRVAGYLTVPTAANGIVYAGSQDGNLYALHAANGIVLWRSFTGGELHVQPQVHDGLVFVGTAIFLSKDDPNSTPTHLLAYDAVNGHQSWSYTFPPNKYDGYAPIFVGNGQLFTISYDDDVDIHVIDILQSTTGKLIQQQSLTISGYSSSFLTMMLAQ
jgi:eukaryotic-like serine/threonine-protein kinase